MYTVFDIRGIEHITTDDYALAHQMLKALGYGAWITIND